MTLAAHRRPPAAPLVGLAALVACALMWAGNARASASDDLKVAKNNYEFGDFAKTVQLLSALPDIAVLPLESERIEAYRLLGLAEFFLSHRAQAENAFFGLLKQNPEFTLDPFYVPPDAVAFFDEVKKANEEYLAPIRERRRARLREQAAEDAARKEAERRRGETQRITVPPTIVHEKTFRENERFATFIPFGAGQFQNGDPTAGRVLAISQVVAGLTSLAMWFGIELLRDQGDRFSPGNFALANNLDLVKFASGAVFYALWAGGAIESNVHFVPNTLLEEKTLVPGLTAPETAPAPVRTPLRAAPAAAPAAAPPAPDLLPQAPPTLPPGAPALDAPAPRAPILPENPTIPAPHTSADPTEPADATAQAGLPRE